MMLRSAFLLAALALSAPARADVVSKVERARALMNQGNAHELAGKFNDAFDVTGRRPKPTPAHRSLYRIWPC